MKQKIKLEVGQKLIYFAKFFKPSMVTIKEIEVNNALLDNQVRIRLKPNKHGEFENIGSSIGFAIILNEETQKILDAANAYHQMDFTNTNYQTDFPSLSEIYQKATINRDIEAAERILKIKRLYDKIIKIINE